MTPLVALQAPLTTACHGCRFHTLVLSVDGAFTAPRDLSDVVHVIKINLASHISRSEEEDATVDAEADGDEDLDGEDEAVALWLRMRAEQAAAVAAAARETSAFDMVGKAFRWWIKAEAKVRRHEWIAWATVHGEDREVTGRMALWKRPSPEEVAQFKRDGATMVVTLLHDERAEPLARAAKSAGLAWVWCPLDHDANKEGSLRRNADMWARLARSVCKAACEIRRGGSVVIHCSAGLNRTGLFAYALLRNLGYDREAANDAITAMRPVTSRCPGKVRFQVGDAMRREPAAYDETATAGDDHYVKFTPAVSCSASTRRSRKKDGQATEAAVLAGAGAGAGAQVGARSSCPRADSRCA